MFSKKWTIYKTQKLNKFMKRKYKKTANLLTGSTEQSEEDQVENQKIIVTIFYLEISR